MDAVDKVAQLLRQETESRHYKSFSRLSEGIVNMLRDDGWMQMSDQWEIVAARVGAESELLSQGWEPFAVVAEDTSCTYNNGRDTQYRSTIWIYLRRRVSHD